MKLKFTFVHSCFTCRKYGNQPPCVHELEESGIGVWRALFAPWLSLTTLIASGGRTKAPSTTGNGGQALIWPKALVRIERGTTDPVELVVSSRGQDFFPHRFSSENSVIGPENSIVTVTHKPRITSVYIYEGVQQNLTGVSTC
jgi:hypothetical protein